MQTGPEYTRDLVLIGGGHSHVSVIKQLAMQPVAGLRISVISRDIHTPYSGMLPGLVAGHYAYDDCHIDLRQLCEWAGCRLFHSNAVRIDTRQQQVYCDNRPPLRYDWLSINAGSTPQLAAIAGAQQHGIAVKPIDKFTDALEQWLAQLPGLAQDLTLSVVGGGAASVELILAIHYRIAQIATQARVKYQLLSADERLLPGYEMRVADYFIELFRQRDIAFVPGYRVQSIEQQQIIGVGKEPLHSDFTVWAINAGAPQWLSNSEIALDEQGFVLVSEKLQSTSHANIFAAGDCANFAARALPKSGVYAVRQGPVLAQNLRRVAQGKALLRYRPQRTFLSLLATGERNAVASKGRLFTSGPWVWRWKSHIDRKFMQRFTELPTRSAMPAISTPGEQMRCGGCGAKVGGEALQNVLEQLALDGHGGGDIVQDDAAVFTPPVGQQMVQTIDHFRAFIDDPYLVGRIGANHCLGDIYAMGATPDSALALANVPFGHPRIMQDTLYQMMRGALDCLQEANTALLGGHSSEAGEMAFGLTVNGHIAPGQALLKGGLQPGQSLLLSKPLGTGTVLAANMLHRAKGRWVEGALECMQISNAGAARVMRRFGATACTDITGFGLLGHLVEMLQAAQLSARIFLEAIPLLPGAEECLQQGWFSSLHVDNARHGQFLHNAADFSHRAKTNILYDPQSAGGLLFSCNPEMAQSCLTALARSGYTAAIIGETQARAGSVGVTLA